MRSVRRAHAWLAGPVAVLSLSAASPPSEAPAPFEALDVADRALDLALDERPAPAAATADPVPSQGVAVAPSDLNGYIGVYRNLPRFTVEVVRRARSLLLRRFGRESVMRALGNRRFRVDLPGGGEEVIVFGPDRGGRAAFLQMNVWTLARVTP